MTVNSTCYLRLDCYSEAFLHDKTWHKFLCRATNTTWRNIIFPAETMTYFHVKSEVSSALVAIHTLVTTMRSVHVNKSRGCLPRKCPKTVYFFDSVWTDWNSAQYLQWKLVPLHNLLPTIGHRPRMRPSVAERDRTAASVSCFRYSTKGLITYKMQPPWT